MEFGPKRGHFVFIFENVVKDFGLLIIALIVCIVRQDFTLLLNNIVVTVIVLASPFMRITQYLFTYYSIDAEKLIVKSGWISKHNMEIPLSTITTVDFSQNVIHQLVGVYKLNVDNASNISNTKTKIQMTFGKEDAVQIKSLLLKNRKEVDGFNLESKGEEERRSGKTYAVSIMDIMMMGALKSKGVFICTLIAALSAVMPYIGLSDDTAAEMAVNTVNTLGVTASILILTLIISLLAVICGAVGSLIRYYGFKVLDNGEALRIEYGLLTKKKYTIHKKKISGFYYEQSFFMRLTGRGVLHIFAIGYGESGDEDSSEEPLLLPFMRSTELNGTVGSIIPEMSEISTYERPVKKSFRYFFYSFGFVFSLLLLGAFVGMSLTIRICEDIWIIGIIILLYAVAGIYMQYKNNAIYGNQKNVSMQYGGFKKTTVFVKTNNIESVSEKAGLFKHRKGITTVEVGYIAPLIKANQRVKNVSVHAYDNIRSKLIY